MIALYVSFVDCPECYYTPINQDTFDKIKQNFQTDNFKDIENIFEVDADAWIVIADSVEKAKLIALARQLVDISKLYCGETVPQEIKPQAYVEFVENFINEYVELLQTCEQDDLTNVFHQFRWKSLVTT